MKLLIALLLFGIAVIVVKTMFFSFRAQSPAEYADTAPAFSLKTHLSGPILSEGLIYGPDGRVTSRFTAQMHGTWEGDTGTLSEAFTYSTGRKQNRKWFLTLGPDNSFTATADDIVGTARGVVSGATVRMDYKIILPPEAGGHVLTVTDWLYLTDNGVILNRSELRKYGFKVAELLATMRPDPER